ncbi:uncharacterized protein A4U43_C08F9470 [Asparagus officinalis]|nr:uncharacterized protein A4U43_C08F9470 [Asparagus officinalis]
MAFHVACPITCRRICDCELGFGGELRGEKARERFWGEIEALEEFLRDPWTLRVGGGDEGTVQICFIGVHGSAPLAASVRFAKVLNVGHGPYVCSKHTRCHSCGSAVPGNGPSTRWFLGYTCCDACGRLFVKGNYCPVCLKVYRDSETTPMVCCDICERWIHCSCDGISDDKYQQFQADQNLQYTCAACRGDCYQVRDTDDAVRELWKRKDIDEHKLIASLRAGAGLPSQDDGSPDSDDELNCPVIPKTDYGRSLKFSVKGLSDKSAKNSKECTNIVSKNVLANKTPTKKSIKFVSNTEGAHQNYDKKNGQRSLESTFRTGQHFEGNKYNTTKEFGVDNVNKTKVQTDSKKSQGLHFKECTAKTPGKNETVKGTKLVIHLGSKNRNVSSSPMSETSSCHREQEFPLPYGNEDFGQQKTNDIENHIHEVQSDMVRGDGKGAKFDNTTVRRRSKHGDKEENVMESGMVPDKQKKNNGSIDEESMAARDIRSESDDDVVLLKKKQPVGSAVNLQNDGGHNTSRVKFVSSTVADDPKPLLKLKFKNPYFEQRSSWASRGEEENPVKGQRSKRKRPSTTFKVGGGTGEEENSNTHLAKIPSTDQEMEANWILQKLGKDAIGKRVEVHHSSDNSWRKGVVSDVTLQGGSKSSSSLLVLLDDGRSTTLDLRKQAVRFASQQQNKRAKTRY